MDNNELKKIKKEKIQQIIVSALSELDKIDQWTCRVGDDKIEHKEYDLKINRHSILNPHYVKFPFKYRFTIRKKLKTIQLKNELKNLDFVIDLLADRYPLQITCPEDKIMEWCDKNLEHYEYHNYILYIEDGPDIVAFKLRWTS